MNNKNVFDWLLRLLKGMLIGTGFILPGISGGALAAVFGLYERIIGFIAHITKNFWQNVLFFVPVGIGMLAGIVILSRPLSFFLENYEVFVLWFFVGAIIGTLPEMWKKAGEQGRSVKHIIIMLATLVLGLLFLLFAEKMFSGQFPLNTFTWFAAGAIIALGILIPGMSPSNFLVYFGMYKPMVDSFKNLDITVLVPLFAGLVICIILLSKAVDLLINKAYSGLFHFILGIVVASTFMIVPTNYNYLQAGSIICALSCVAGIVVAYYMCLLGNKYE
jgi:putative membrane protein